MAVHRSRADRSLTHPRRMASTLSIAMLVVGTAIAVPTAAAAAAPGTAAAAPAVAARSSVGAVNPFIGTQDEGNTFPGAAVPFGMVQLSPDTGHNTGYDYTQSKIRGFSMTHLSGVGCGLAGVVPVLPATSIPTNTDYAAYAAGFDHASEDASPGAYDVTLQTTGGGDVRAELGATEHTGVQQYTFPATGTAAVLINAGQSLSTVSASSVAIVDDRTVRTSSTVRGFCRDTEPFTVFSTTRFDRPFSRSASGTWTGNTVTAGSTEADTGRTGAVLVFDPSTDRTVQAQTAISYVDAAGADANLAAEATTLDAARSAAGDLWAERLGTIDITGGSAEQRTTFYSSLYRSFLAPTVGSDVDGRYRGWGTGADQLHGVEPGRKYYQNFSLWDTYRTQEQLLALLAPKEAGDQAVSLLLQAEQGGWAPRWSYGPVETNIMTGDPVTPFLVTAWSQGLLAGHEERTYAVLKQNADGVPPADSPYNGRAGNESYLADGFVPYAEGANGKEGDFDLQHGGSATLEYALADGTLSTMARALGHGADADRYATRAANASTLWDRDTKTFRARTPGGAFDPQDDPAYAPGFHEGTTLQYTWLHQQNFPQLVQLLGGKGLTQQRLDEFFAYDALLTDRDDTVHNVWVTGSYDYYGRTTYNPNNEPDLHAPYAYLWAGQPWKTSDVVRAALTLFTDGPTGVTGNDDLGTMSAWHVLSSIGLYPAVPGTDQWALTTPAFERVAVHPGGAPDRIVTLTAPGVSDASHYIQSVNVDGLALDRGYLSGTELAAADSIAFSLGSTPSAWATGPDAAPAPLTTAVPVDRLTASGAAAATTIAAGRSAPVALTVVAQTGTPVTPVIGLDGALPAGLRVELPTAAAISGDRLPTQLTPDVTVRVDAGTAPGPYSIPLRVTAGSLSRTAQLQIVVPTEPFLAAGLTQRAIGTRGGADADFDGDTAYYLADALATSGVAQGIPQLVPGSTDLRFVLAPPGSAADNLVATGRPIDVSHGLAGSSRIAIVGAAANGPITTTMTLAYADGTSTRQDVTLPDWCGGTPPAGITTVSSMPVRGRGTDVQSVGCGLFASAPIPVKSGITLRSITFGANPKFHVFAIAADGEPQAPTPTATPVVVGTPAVGRTVAVDPPVWEVPSSTTVATSYQWNVDGQAVAGATGRLFTLRPADLGKSLTVTVTGTAAGWAPAVVTSAPVIVTAGTFTATRPTRISGAPTVGEQVSAVAPSWSVAGVSVEYTWVTGSRQLGSGPTLRIPPGAVGQKLMLITTARLAGYTPVVLRTAPVIIRAGVLFLAAAPRITGTARVGARLTAVAARFQVPVRSTYRWLAGGTPIVGATASTLIVPRNAVGRRITVQVTATAAGYQQRTTTAGPTAVVPAP